jgi:repressor LexA
MAKGLTARQREVLARIIQHIEEHNCPPTIRELAAELNITSTNGVRDHLRALMEKGFIKRNPRLSRGIELTGEWRALVRRELVGPASHPATLPVIGQVAAGSPILAQENIEDTLTLDARWVREGDFALRVRGDSMCLAGIFEGDYVVVRQQPVAQPGDIVVALVGDEATVKRFYPEEGRIRLQPEHPTMEPIFIRAGDPTFRIVGKVTAVFRVL